MANRPSSLRALLALSILALVVLAVAPSKYTGWVRALRNPLEVLLTPASQPFSMLSAWLRPGGPAFHDATDLEKLRAEHEQYKYLWLRALDQMNEMRELARELKSGFGDVRRVPASRIAADPAEGTIEFGRGRSDGVALEDAVAVAQGSEQIVGPVLRVGPGSCTVRLITDSKRLTPKRISCAILPDDPRKLQADLATFPRCELTPLDDGTFASYGLSAELAAKMKEGDEARVSDPAWPAARMLVVGRVIKITDGDLPVFKRIVVRPLIDIARVRSVWIQSPTAPPANTGASVPPPSANPGRKP